MVYYREKIKIKSAMSKYTNTNFIKWVESVPQSAVFSGRVYVELVSVLP